MGGGQGCDGKAACKGMAAGCGQTQAMGCGQAGKAGCKGMAAGCGQMQAMGCGQAGKAACKGMAAGCGQMQAMGCGSQSVGPHACGTIVAPSEWGPKKSLADYLRCFDDDCCMHQRRGGSAECGPGPRAGCGESCKEMGVRMPRISMPGCEGEMMNAQSPCGGAPPGRPSCNMKGNAPAAPMGRHCEQKK